MPFSMNFFFIVFWFSFVQLLLFWIYPLKGKIWCKICCYKCQFQFTGSNYVNDDNFSIVCAYDFARTIHNIHTQQQAMSQQLQVDLVCRICSTFVAFDSNDVVWCTLHISHTQSFGLPNASTGNSDVNTKIPCSLCTNSFEKRFQQQTQNYAENS